MKNINLIIALSFITCFLGNVYAQPTLEWVKSMGGSSNDIGKEIVIDNLGNTYTVGEFSSVVDFDPGAGVTNLTSFGSIDVFIQKLDANGNLLWVKQIGGTNSDKVASIALDGNGDLVIAGEFKGTADFDPGVGVTALTAVGSYYDTYIAKLDNNGNLIWVKQIDGTHHCFAIDLGISSVDDIFLTGRWFQTADFDPNAGVSNLTAAGSGWDTYILKLTTNGNFVWVKQITCTDNMYTQALAIDLSDNVLVSGYYYATIDVDPGPGTVNYTGSLIQEEMYILKLDNNGIYVWSQNYTSPSTEMAYSIHVDANNDYYFAGWFSSALDFDAGAGSTILTPSGGAGSDAFLLKLNSSGAIQWVNQMGGTGEDEAFSVTSNSAGDILVAGMYSGTADLDPGAGTDNFTSAGLRDIFFQKVLPNGTYQWSLAMGGTGNDYVNSIANGPNDEIYSTGYFNLTADFDPGVGVVNATSAGSGDIYVHKLSSCVPGAPVPDVAVLSDLNGECSVSAPTAPTASSCGTTYNGTPDVIFPITSQGTYTITWTYDDGNGNTSTQTQSVTIDDATAPVANNAILSDVTAECEVTSLTGPTATDNCAGSIVGTHNATLPITVQGSTTVTWTYDDGNGNTSTQTQDVVVTDATAPIADLANLADINDECEATPTAPTATDNCSGAITGTPDVVFPITASGTTTITWTYDDGNGNTATQTQNVIITPIDNGITQVDAVTLSADATGYNYQWVDCDNGNAPVSGATSQSFTPTIAGNYACEVDNGTCTVTTACLTSSVGLVENSFGSALVVYPNPTFGNLKVDLGDVYNGTTVKVFNALGKVVINEAFGSTDEINLNIEGTPGMYILEINTEEGKTARVNLIKE